MKFAPLIMLLFGYWCMGNMQIFNDKIVEISNNSEPITTEHSIAPSGNQALPLFIVGMLVLLGFIFTDLFSKCMKKIGLMQMDDLEVVDEQIGEYFESISVVDRKRWYA